MKCAYWIKLFLFVLDNKILIAFKADLKAVSDAYSQEIFQIKKKKKTKEK